MQIPFERAIARFDFIHAEMKLVRMPFSTRVTKVDDKDDLDDAFLEYVSERWQLFDPTIYHRATWSGAVNLEATSVPKVGCQQWFAFGFYAAGPDPFCAMDSDGKFRKGDINKQHLLEIYNHPFKRHLRETVLNRKKIDYCKSCPLMS